MNTDKLIQVEQEIYALVPPDKPIIANIITAQLQILKFLRDPMMMLSITDVILQNLETSLRSAQGPDQRKWLQEQSAMVIQNYLVMIHAGVKHQIRQNESEAKRLLNDGARMLADSIFRTLSQSSGNNTHHSRASDAANRLLLAVTEEDENASSFFSRLINWLYRKEKAEQMKKEFMRMAEQILEKISRRKKLIGRSAVISEMFHNYIREIHEYKCRAAGNKAREAFEKLKDIYWLPVITLVILTVTALIHPAAWIASWMFSLEWSISTWKWLCLAWYIFWYSIPLALCMLLLVPPAMYISLRIKYMIEKQKHKAAANELDPEKIIDR